jgi:hypothetical protein
MKRILHFIFVSFLILVSAHDSFSQACVNGAEMVVDGTGTYIGGFEGAASTTNLSTLGFTSSLSTTNAYPKCNGGAPVVTDDASCGCSKCFEPAAGTPHSGSNALLFDAGGSTVENIVCKNLTFTSGTVYDVSAFYQCAAITSTGAGNIANMAITVTGSVVTGGATVQVGPTAAVSNQGSYDQQSCFFKATAAGTVNVCIQIQPTDLVNPGSFGAGNDVLIDDFSVKSTTGGGTCTSGTCTYPVLPVKLVYFAAKRFGENDVSLQWTSASEENFSYYLVEKSYDGVNFGEITEATAKGSSNGLTNYEYDDGRFDKSCYYRLRIVDLDGKFAYSSVVFVQKESDYVWLVNTGSGDDLKIKALVKKNTAWNIACYSMLGQEYFNVKISLYEGENIIPLNNSAFIDRNPKILRIIDDDGKVILTKVF